MRPLTSRASTVAFAISIATLGLTTLQAGAFASSSAAAFIVNQILSGSSLQHSYTPSGSTTAKTESLSNPDDVTADPVLGGVIATVNEDANSALYLIKTTGATASGEVTRYAYSEALPHGGGTDAISVYHGRILISASAPGTSGDPAPQATYPAVYEVDLDSATKIAKVTPLFDDEAEVTVANSGSSHGQTTKLALTDPDSNEVVPSYASRFEGDFMLTSQGDKQQVFVSAAESSRQRLSLLNLTQSVDDTAWPSTSGGRLYSTDATDDAVDVITGSFHRGTPMAIVTPCGANGSPATCPAPGFPNNYLASIDPNTGAVTAVTVKGATYLPQGGLAFVGGRVN